MGESGATSGKITLDGAPFGKQLRRRLGYVLQNDIFFSNLTLWETLYFTAMIRLPERLIREEKLKSINEYVDILGIRKCLHAAMGDMFTRGQSGGEKKRASVACELRTDPDIILIDVSACQMPTSGLDSSTSLKLVKQLKDFAVSLNKTILVTIHQPASQIYHLFDNLLLLTRGQEVSAIENADHEMMHESQLRLQRNDVMQKSRALGSPYLIRGGNQVIVKMATFMPRQMVFSIIFWTYQPAVQAILTCPSERGLISKERFAVAYRLSAIYLARTVSEPPLTIVVPALFYAFVYWMACLNDVTACFMTWPILLLSVVSIQGFDLLIDSLFTNIKVALLTCDACILIWLLLCVFFTQTFSWWLRWARYVSHVYYPLAAITIINSRGLETVSCNNIAVLLMPKCSEDVNSFITDEDILYQAGMVLPVYCYISTLAVVCVLFRIAIHIALRVKP